MDCTTEKEAEEEPITQEDPDQDPPHNPFPPKHVFILSGQSNMSGRGGVDPRRKKWDGVVPPECLPSPSILRFSARSRWVEARDPLHADIDVHKTCGVGPGMAFVHALLQNDSFGAESEGAAAPLLGLVPCAVGGTAIREWEKGSKLYREMVRRAKESLMAAGAEIRAVLWYQGESDTVSAHVADSYRFNMEKFIHDLRSDLGLPSLPFIQVAIASGDEPYMEKVREAQLGMDLPNVVCVDAKGLPLNKDCLHLTTEAQVRLGHMLAESYIKNFASAAAQEAPTCT